MKKPEQLIQCQIESCRHNLPDHHCALTSISICPCRPCDCDSVAHRSESMCANFEKKEKGMFG